MKVVSLLALYAQNHKSLQIVFCFQKMKIDELEVSKKIRQIYRPTARLLSSSNFFSQWGDAKTKIFVIAAYGLGSELWQSITGIILSNKQLLWKFEYAVGLFFMKLWLTVMAVNNFWLKRKLEPFCKLFHLCFLHLKDFAGTDLEPNPQKPQNLVPAKISSFIKVIQYLPKMCT